MSIEINNHIVGKTGFLIRNYGSRIIVSARAAIRRSAEERTRQAGSGTRAGQKQMAMARRERYRTEALAQLQSARFNR